jgi:hypothetical protein
MIDDLIVNHLSMAHSSGFFLFGVKREKGNERTSRSAFLALPLA